MYVYTGIFEQKNMVQMYTKAYKYIYEISMHIISAMYICSRHLFLGYFKRFQVITNDLQLFLQLKDLPGIF